MKATWSVFSMVKEPAHVLRRFVEHHLNAGASYVHLFFDDPDDPALDEFVCQPGVIVQQCGADYWNSMNRRTPPFVERRQLLNGRVAYERCLTDWQAHFDADELVVTRNSSLGAQLATILDSHQAAHLRTIEPMMVTSKPTNGQVPFRCSVRHLRYRARRRIYGNDLQVFPSGLFGHHQGKSILRAGSKRLAHGIHLPRSTVGDTGNILFNMEDAWIAHMHCENRDQWVKTTLRKMHDSSYNMRTGNYTILSQLALDAKPLDNIDNWTEEELLEILGSFYDRVGVLSEDLSRRLEKFDLLQYHKVALLE